MSKRIRAVSLAGMVTVILTGAHVAHAAGGAGLFDSRTFPCSKRYSLCSRTSDCTPATYCREMFCRPHTTLPPVRLCGQSADCCPLPVSPSNGDAAFRCGDYPGAISAWQQALVERPPD